MKVSSVLQFYFHFGRGLTIEGDRNSTPVNLLAIDAQIQLNVVCQRVFRSFFRIPYMFCAGFWGGELRVTKHNLWILFSNFVTVFVTQIHVTRAKMIAVVD